MNNSKIDLSGMAKLFYKGKVLTLHQSDINSFSVLGRSIEDDYGIDIGEGIEYVKASNIRCKMSLNLLEVFKLIKFLGNEELIYKINRFRKQMQIEEKVHELTLKHIQTIKHYQAVSYSQVINKDEISTVAEMRARKELGVGDKEEFEGYPASWVNKFLREKLEKDSLRVIFTNNNNWTTSEMRLIYDGGSGNVGEGVVFRFIGY